MWNKITLLLLMTTALIQAQIKGLVTDKNKQILPFVNIYVQDTYIGTTTNDEGKYELNISKTGNYTIIFQYLGYKTVKKTVSILTFPYLLDVTLLEDEVALAEVEINSKENLANEIIRKTIKNREANLLKTMNFTADFYSRGIYRIKNAPKKILGQELGDMGGGLDSTRSGVIYLSETISKITKNPKNFNEHIIASKVSGNDNGFSFNQASGVNFNFYKNIVELGDNLISPISSTAFNYYSYKLINSFYEDKHLINKIQVIPKRITDNVFEGFIYIAENDWALYGVELSVTGKQLQIPAIKKLTLTQNYSYSQTDKLWSIFSQSIDFQFGIFGFNIDGRFTAVYSNYNFNPLFTSKTFTNEVLSFEDKANKKDSVFWKMIRPVPLTFEEVKDYQLKDSIKTIRKSEKYLDSVDLKRNKFGFSNIILGYRYQKSFKNWNLNIGSPLFNSQFNTVQGWHTNMETSFFKYFKDKKQSFWINSNFDYGFSDKILRPNASFTYQFNNQTKPYISVSGGRKLTQFNQNNPISAVVNSVTSLFFERNYAKFYDKTFAKLAFGKELLNGLEFSSSIAYEVRTPVFNATDYTVFNRNAVDYSSNNPLTPNNFTSVPFEANKLFKFSVKAQIKFGQEYISLPDQKINLGANKYPKIDFNYTKGFAASNSKFNYDFVETKIFQTLEFGNKGNFSYNLKAGTFLNKDELAFADYKHFNGNETHINIDYNTLETFNLLPYYDLSTNGSYAEFHFQHHFNGYVLRKIPLINKLQFKLVLGANVLMTKNKQPYSEYNIGVENIGFGKIRFLRIDFVRSNFNGNQVNGLMFGLNL